MNNFLMAIFAVLVFVSTSFADDPMTNVFDKVDDLIIRVETGVSLNNFAETYAEMKIEYKKALSEPGRPTNYVLNDRMKEVFKLLDKYAELWKMQETDKFKYMKTGNRACYVEFSVYSSAYDISCEKGLVLSELKPLIEKSKSAHYNGW